MVGLTRIELATLAIWQRNAPAPLFNRSCYVRSFYKTKPTLTSGLHFLKSGPDKDRTCDLLHAMQALSQLSYRPVI